MKRLILLFLLIPSLAWGGAANGFFFAPGGPLFTPRKAPTSFGFYWDGASAGNQTFTNTQVLDSTAEGMQSGYKNVLSVVDAAGGSVGVASNKLTMTGSGTATDTQLYHSSELLSRTIRYGFGVQIDTTATGRLHIITTTNAGVPSTHLGVLEINGAALCVGSSGSPSCLSTKPLTVSTSYYFFVYQGVLGSDGPPMSAAEPVENFTTGNFYLAKGGTEFTNWSPVALDNSSADANFTFGIQQRSNTNTMDNVSLVKNLPLSLLVPKIGDRFNGSSGTLLSAHTMDIGGKTWAGRYCDTNADDINDATSYVPKIGTSGSAADCSSNAACTENNTIGYAYVDSEEANGLIYGTVVNAEYGSYFGYWFRVSADTAGGINGFRVARYYDGVPRNGLIKYNNGAESILANISTNPHIDFMVRYEGSQIFLNTSNSYQIITDSFNSSATWVGIGQNGCSTTPYINNVPYFAYYSLANTGTGVSYESVFSGIYP